MTDASCIKLVVTELDLEDRNEAYTEGIAKPCKRCGHMAELADVIAHTSIDAKKEFILEYVIDGDHRLGAIHAKLKQFQGKHFYMGRGISVIPSCRRMGIGEALFLAAVNESHQRGYPFLSLNRWGKASRGFWDKQLRLGKARIISKTGGNENGKPSEAIAIFKEGAL